MKNVTYTFEARATAKAFAALLRLGAYPAAPRKTRSGEWTLITSAPREVLAAIETSIARVNASFKPARKVA